jgi:hypothetical protein
MALKAKLLPELATAHPVSRPVCSLQVSGGNHVLFPLGLHLTELDDVHYCDGQTQAGA